MNLYKKIKNKIKYFYKKWNSSYINKIRYIASSSAEKKRYNYYKKRLKYLGKNVKFDTGVFITGMEYISIDDNTHIDKNCIIVGSTPNLDLSHRVLKEKINESDLIQKGEVYIGKSCHIAQNTMIFGYGGVYIGNYCAMSTGAKIYSLTNLQRNPFDNSDIDLVITYDGPTLIGKVILEDNTWLGINVVVSPGITIKKNSFVRSNSFVLKSFDENSYIAGDPAEYKRKRYNI